MSNSTSSRLSRFTDWLLSLDAAVVATILCLIPQFVHTLSIYQQNAVLRGEPNWLAYLVGFVFALGLEFSILIFTLHGKKWTATFFMMAAIVTNFLFFGLSWDSLSAFSASVMLSVVIPVAIKTYAALVDEKRQPVAAPEVADLYRQQQQLFTKMEQSQEGFESRLNKLDEQLLQVPELVSTLQEEKNKRSEAQRKRREREAASERPIYNPDGQVEKVVLPVSLENKNHETAK